MAAPSGNLLKEARNPLFTSTQVNAVLGLLSTLDATFSAAYSVLAQLERRSIMSKRVSTTAGIAPQRSSFHGLDLRITRLSTTERTILQRFAAQARTTLGDHLVSIVLFGSRARGDARPDSDIDVLLVVRNLEKISCLLERLDDIVFDLLLEYGLLLAIVPVEESEYARQECMLHRFVQREGIRIV